MIKRKNTAKRKAMEVASQTHRAFHLVTSLEDYLRACAKYGSTLFKLEIKQLADDAVGIEITPTIDPLIKDAYDNPINSYLGYAMRFNVEPKRAIDNLMKYLREKTNDRIVK